nr:NADP-dependent isocitrate dehydrogenase [Candidatus Krumholzibacteria bacterium]
LYWAQALAKQDQDAELKTRFAQVAASLGAAEETITAELLGAQGKAQDIGGYFHPDEDMAEQAMRPSAAFNAVIEAM